MVTQGKAACSLSAGEELLLRMILSHLDGNQYALYLCWDIAEEYGIDFDQYKKELVNVSWERWLEKTGCIGDGLDFVYQRIGRYLNTVEKGHGYISFRVLKEIIKERINGSGMDRL